jgi:hypothetical protein
MVPKENEKLIDSVCTDIAIIEDVTFSCIQYGKISCNKNNISYQPDFRGNKCMAQSMHDSFYIIKHH